MRWKPGIWIGVFAAFTVLPSVLFWCVSPWLTETSSEQRTLAEKPVLAINALETFPQAFDSYYNDHLPFRNQLIYGNSILRYKYFGESTSDQVLVGNDGWLFFDSYGSIRDFKGMLLFSEEELRQIKSNLLHTQEVLQKQGMEYILMICPNKETVYPEYVPEYVKRVGEVNRTQQLIRYLEGSGITIVYPLEELQAAKGSGNLYYPLDSHWNLLGAYVGAGSLCEAAGVSLPGLPDVSLEPDPNPKDDLAGMLNLSGQLDYGENQMVTKYSNSQFEVLEDEYYGIQSSRSDADNGKRIFVVRDSYSIALFDYLASSFTEYYSPHYDGFTPEMLEEYPCDIFVFQVVERSINKLLTFSVE